MDEEVDPLTALPATLADPGGGLLRTLGAGTVSRDPVVMGRRAGRVRRWHYVAAGDARTAVGAAVVDLGVVGTVFAWALVGGRIVTWDRRLLPGQAQVSATGTGGAYSRGHPGTVALSADGSLRLDVPTSRGRLRAVVRTTPGTPAVLSTATPGGGWNVTQKQAGHGAQGFVEVGGRRAPLAGGGWCDWTAGRQDRRTRWRWAAAAGSDTDGRRVGLNASTGMNASGPGEDVVWWDGTPYPLAVTTLAPDGDPRAGWTVAGSTWSLAFTPVGVRVADERLLVLRSTYVQPVGTFSGTLPGPEGTPVAVEATGVTEEHEALW